MVAAFAWRRWSMTLTLLLASCAAAPAWALYLQPQLDKVPIERVLTNLEDQAEAKPKEPKLKFNLARAYAMAYATKPDEVQTQKGELWFGFEPQNVPFAAKPTDDKAKKELAEKRLAKAIETYEAALELAPDDIVGRLGYAWCLDQAGQDKEAAVEYRKVIAAAWKTEEKREFAGPGFHSVTVEAGRYLAPLLDKEKDAKELAQLADYKAKMDRIPRAITPIAVPLRDGLTAADIEDRAARVAFDADGTGLKDQRWTWIKPNSGWLVYDRQRTGKIDSALQLFGSVTFWMFWEHGYEPLATLDDNGDGELRGTELVGLAIWHDANSNGVSEPGEVKPLADHGIVAVNCRHEVDAAHPDRIEFSRAGVTFESGATRPTYDVRLQPRK